MRKEIPVACCHTVFTKEQRVEYKSVWGELEARRLRVTEIEKGYEYQFPGDPDTLRLLIEWVSLERKCCPFLTFTVRASREEEPIWLPLTGNEEAKTFLSQEINENISNIIQPPSV
ncbi:hypothetical protein ACFQZT_14775 [Paenibacillus sp. GCM10027628]|uniref:hypothetical protein n=1 Tax=Paenibacillus sp. GCM10027628 TaxID=3273413 RepID=UPI0036360E25